MMLTCKEATRLVSQGLDRRLPLGQRATLRLHVAICKGCRNARAQLQFLRTAMQKLSEIG